MNHNDRMGIDIGGVLKNLHHEGAPDDETAFIRDPPMTGSFELLRDLSDTYFKDRIWIISKAKPSMQSKLLKWLDFHEFWKKTAIPGDHVYFVDDDDEKPVRAKKLRLTHFIDDKVGILRQLAGIGIQHLFLYKPVESPDEYLYGIASEFTIVRSWTDVRAKLIA